MHLPAALRLVALSGLLAGCVSQLVAEPTREGYAADGAVNAEMVEQPDAARYQPVQGSAYLSPQPIRESARPEYPAGLLEQELPSVTLVARIVVSGAGALARAEVIERSHDQPAFEDAVVAAVRTWVFIPQTNGRAVVEAGETR